MLLMSDDRLFAYEGNYSDVNVLNLDPLQWECIQIPTAYLAMNWPIEITCIDDSGTFIAVSGKRGLAHYSCSSGKWKMFGNEQQEQSFHVRTMLWCRNILIVSCTDMQWTPNRESLLFFDHYLILESSS